MNDPTTTKQEVNGASGLVVLANNTVTKRYWHADVSLGAPAPAPTASFTASPTSGTAPVAVSFTDTSTGSPTSWAWNFGDGSTSTLQNPSHTYTAAGTYTVSLTATNANGSSAPSTRTITVTGSTNGAPTASFTASPTSGTAPLAVSFTDTSTGSPTSWAWNFGDGSTSTVQSPSHTYTAAGTYTVTLTASNATGSSAPATRSVTVTGSTPPPAGSVTAGASTTGTSTAAVTAVTVGKPAGVTNGDVLIAQITANANPSIASAPSGWSTVISPLSISTGARVFVYYHVVTNAAAEPASYTWQLSAAQKWNAVVSDFHGVNATTPFDTAASTRVDTTYSATTVAVPGVTTATSGAMLVGGVGLDSSATGITQPSGWTEGGEGTGAQVAELASQARPSAGATGTATWTLSNAAASAGWLRALRPA
jgi:PKD repeat protein